MQYKTVLEKLMNKQDLTTVEVQWVMQQILTESFGDAEIAALLVALSSKGESVLELSTAASILRNLAERVIVKRPHVIDIVGTGGDCLQTFNISTACCFIVAAAGGTVAKIGNRAFSSRSGSADMLELAGVNLARTPEQIKTTIEKLGVGFLFAPKHHSAMANVAKIRKTLGVRTIFNLMGPLTNPANAQYHLIGVNDKKWLMPFAEVLKNLSSKKALIVHGNDGLDEISLAAPTQIAELSNQKITLYEISPEQFGIKTQSLQTIKADSPAASLAMVLQVFNNESGPTRDIVLLNAGAALYAADLAVSIAAGIETARELLASGKVLRLFNEFVRASI